MTLEKKSAEKDSKMFLENGFVSNVVDEHKRAPKFTKHLDSPPLQLSPLFFQEIKDCLEKKLTCCCFC